MSDSPSLCLIPWLHRFTNEQGFHELCCSGEGTANTLHDADGAPLHVSQNLTDSELLNSPDLKAIRRGMLKGHWPAACERCRRTEAAGSLSTRNHIAKRFGKWHDEVVGDTLPDGALEVPQVRYADIRLGNVCNLTCRMCGPHASRLWVDHYNVVLPGQMRLRPDVLNRYRDGNWVKSQPVRWLMEQCLPSVESLHFAGGEPLIIPEMVELLEQCVSSGRAGQIDLSYNTNMTVLPEKVTRLWPHFRGVSVMGSVDGFGRVNDYIRRPSKWKDIDRNFRLLDENFERWKLKRVTASATVQVYNVLQLGELYDYLGSGFRHVAPVPLLTALYAPQYLSIQVLPERVKDVVRERLLELREKSRPLLNGRFHTQAVSLEAILGFLDAASGTKAELLHFLYFSEQSDRHFGESWRDSCPELSKILSRSGS